MMLVAYYRNVEPGDITSVGLRMRELDINELKAMSGNPSIDVIKALDHFVNLSAESYTLTIKDKPEGIFGVYRPPKADRGGVVWLLSTDCIKSAGFSLIRKSKKWIKNKLDEYESLHNMVLSSHGDAKRFITVLGFRFGPSVEINGSEFLNFEIRKTSCAESLKP